jgi:chromosome segregation ATPase
MSTQVSASRKRYIDAETLLEAIEAIKPGAGADAGVTIVDFQPILTQLAQMEERVVLALSQLDAKMMTIDRDNDAVVREMQEKLVILMNGSEQVSMSLGSLLALQQQLATAEGAAAANEATATAIANALRQSSELLAANARQADAGTIASLQADIASKEKALAAARQEAIQVKADRDTLQLQVSQAQAAIQAILDGQVPPSNPASSASA